MEHDDEAHGGLWVTKPKAPGLGPQPGLSDSQLEHQAGDDDDDGGGGVLSRCSPGRCPAAAPEAPGCGGAGAELGLVWALRAAAAALG